MLETRPTRERSCSVCGKIETVRQDNRALRCRNCSAVGNGSLGAEVMKTRFPRNECGHCGKSIRGIKKYCDRTCQMADWRAENMEALPTPAHDDLTQLELSRAGEMIVAAELTLMGFPSFLSGAGMAYDVAVDLGHRLIKLQVKTTRGARRVQARVKWSPGYLFHLKRCGTGGKRAYNDGDFDCYALLALDRRQIAFLPVTGSVPQCISLRPAGFEVPKNSKNWKTMGDYPWEACLEALGVKLSTDPGDVV